MYIRKLLINIMKATHYIIDVDLFKAFSVKFSTRNQFLILFILFFDPLNSKRREYLKVMQLQL